MLQEGPMNLHQGRPRKLDAREERRRMAEEGGANPECLLNKTVPRLRSGLFCFFLCS